MGEGVNKRRRNKYTTLAVKLRLLAAITCTAFSFMTGISALAIPPMLPLWIAAGMVYLFILYFWVMTNSVPKAILLIGTVLGAILIVCSPYFIALPMAAPSIMLMLRIIVCSFRARTLDGDIT